MIKLNEKGKGLKLRYAESWGSVSKVAKFLNSKEKFLKGN